MNNMQRQQARKAGRSAGYPEIGRFNGGSPASGPITNQKSSAQKNPNAPDASAVQPEKYNGAMQVDDGGSTPVHPLYIDREMIGRSTIPAKKPGL